MALQYASPMLRKDKVVVLVAMKQNLNALEYADEGLRKRLQDPDKDWRQQIHIDSGIDYQDGVNEVKSGEYDKAVNIFNKLQEIQQWYLS